MASYSILETVKLSKKKFFRAPQWELKLAIRILIGFIVLYFFAAFLFLGVGIYFIAQKITPDQNPVFFINQFLIYYFGIDLLIRYFVQNLPITDIKPLLIQPISKNKIVQGVMLRSLGSFFNWIPVVILLPFCIVYTLNETTTYTLWIWLLGVLFFAGGNNFLFFFINKSRVGAVSLFLLLLLGSVFQNVLCFPLLSFFEKGFSFLYLNPPVLVVPFLLFTATAGAQYVFLKKQLYLDKGFSSRKERIVGSGLTLFDRVGTLGVFIKNDIRLILRNIRARQVVFMGFLFLFYGVIFFTQEVYLESYVMLIFAGIFTTGGFMLTFGQLVPAWDSEYFSFLMCQNIPYRKYLESKLYLMMFSVVISMVLSLPYLYFGLKIMTIIIACAIFNFGMGSFITLYSGAFNATPVKLNVKAKAFENTQNFSLTQLLFTLPKIVLPVLVFYVPFRFFGFSAGILGMILTGLLGLLFRGFLLRAIEKTYQKRKYKTLSSFKKT